jgi:hypothetical protein
LTRAKRAYAGNLPLLPMIIPQEYVCMLYAGTPGSVVVAEFLNGSNSWAYMFETGSDVVPIDPKIFGTVYLYSGGPVSYVFMRRDLAPAFRVQAPQVGLSIPAIGNKGFTAGGVDELLFTAPLRCTLIGFAIDNGTSNGVEHQLYREYAPAFGGVDYITNYAVAANTIPGGDTYTGGIGEQNNYQLPSDGIPFGQGDTLYVFLQDLVGPGTVTVSWEFV